jgi:hypothetical protein
MRIWRNLVGVKLMSDTRTAPDLSKPSFEGLAYLLRHKEFWPEGFAWDYSEIRKCAIGLTNSYWKSDTNHGSWWSRKNSGLSFNAVEHIFFQAHKHHAQQSLLGRLKNIFGLNNICSFRDVQPNQVADLIDTYLVKSWWKPKS